MRKGGRALLPLLCLLLGCGGRQAGQGQGRSLPVSNTTAFADALADQTVTEIILDPGGTGVGPRLCLPAPHARHTLGGRAHVHVL